VIYIPAVSFSINDEECDHVYLFKTHYGCHHHDLLFWNMMDWLMRFTFNYYYFFLLILFANVLPNFNLLPVKRLS